MIGKEFILRIDKYYANSRFDELEAFLLDSLHSTASSDPTFRIIVLNELGTYYRGATRFEEAIHFFHASIAELEKTTGTNSLEYATAINNLGGAYRMSGQFDAARRCFEKMIPIYIQYKGKSPMLYASGINNLALLDMAEHNYDRAIPALQNALAIMSVSSQYRWEQATTICNLGICMLRMGHLEDAESYLIQAHDMICAMPESSQGHLAAIQSALGDLYLKQKEDEKALAAFEAAKSLILKHYGKNSDYRNACQTIKLLKPNPL